MNLLGKGMDPEFWKGVREKKCFETYRNELHKLWNERCENVPIYALKYSDYKMYWNSGNRSVYEGTYFTRRLAMDCSTLLALIYPEEEKYINRVMDQVYAICDEYSWCLPAHQGALEPNFNTKIDLFAAETGFALAEVYTLLGDRLEPLIRNRIMAEFKRRILIPYSTKEVANGWEKCTNNWAAVCMGSVACGIMLLYPEEFYGLKPRIDETFEYYLKGFMDDGFCLEGCGYWHYGFGFFNVYADMVRTFTNGETDYYAREKVKTISTFIQKMFLTEKASVSFADGGPTLSYHLGLLHHLKSIYPDDILIYDPKYSYNYDGCGRFCLQLRSAIWMNEDYYNNPVETSVDATYYGADSQWFIRRTPDYGFAAKAGNNNEHHNHNDVGTFIFAKNGKQLICDLGPGAYTRQYFHEERYTIIEASSRSHNVPVVNGMNQSCGSQFKAVDVERNDNVFSCDIAGAYEAEALKKFKRTFTCNIDFVTVEDEIDYNGEGVVTERFVSVYEPAVYDNYVQIGEAKLYFDEAIKPYVTSEPITRHANRLCYMINFDLPAGTKSFSIKLV